MITKEQVVAKAKELSLTLTEEQTDEYVKQGKLPEVPVDRKAELKEKYNVDQLVDIIVETRGEAAERRRTNAELVKQVESLKTEIGSMNDLKVKTPELEAQLKKSNELLAAMRDAEKKRREAVLASVPEDKRAKVTYLLDVDKVSSDQFDGTVEMLIEPSSPGARKVPGPGDPPTKDNPFSKKHFNLTAQVELRKKDPEAARQLELEAR